MTNKEKFLIKNIGFHYDDLSVARQLELEAIQQTMGLSMDWIYLALSKDSLENWEKWGFSLFKKDDFKKSIDQSLEILDKWGEKELGRKLEKKKTINEINLEKMEKMNYNLGDFVVVSIKPPQRRGAIDCRNHSNSSSSSGLKRGSIFEELDGK